MNDESPTDWLAYYDQTRDRPPHDTLKRAMTAFAAGAQGPLRAVDLGAGVGRDSLPLLEAGWEVLATDKTEAALIELRQRAAKLGAEKRLTTRLAAFETLGALGDAELVNASFSLPFCPPEAFGALWETIRAAIVPGGRFSGHLLGPRDDWSKQSGVTILAKAEVEPLFDGFAIEHLREEEDEGKTAQGKTKRWHIFHLVARRRV